MRKAPLSRRPEGQSDTPPVAARGAGESDPPEWCGLNLVAGHIYCCHDGGREVVDEVLHSGVVGIARGPTP